MRIRHTVSQTMVGHFSGRCRYGIPVAIDSPSERCLVPLPKGVFELRIERERVDLCAECPVAERTRDDQDPFRTAAEACRQLIRDEARHD